MDRSPPMPLRFALLALTAVGAIMPHAAMAALGGPETSASADAATMHAAVKSEDAPGYRVHTMQLPSGTVLREYATVAGTVFAVAWSGPTIPNLQQILGGYYPAFMSGARASRTGHHHLQIRREDFVMQSSGHMRAFTGRAYLPQVIPAGVSLDELH